MNKIKALLPMLLLVAFTFVASAQNAGSYQALNGGTNNVTAASTNTYSLTQSIDEFDNVGIQVSFVASADTNGNVLVKFAKSLDSTTYETTPSITLTVPLNGTNTSCVVSNFSLPSVATLKLTSIEHTNSACYVTNVTVTYRLKSPKRRPR